MGGAPAHGGEPQRFVEAPLGETHVLDEDIDSPESRSPATTCCANSPRPEETNYDSDRLARPSADSRAVTPTPA
ncbi:hypothetical protein Q0Z83_039890 [Actinoplanes sichuanensis]|uniref:Uncharacterized protein n=1 Tax=Actinoplanes sichuanensis TaxID=512349 RepID=A0ABW4A3X2_9ACTN|nr:hypothetical protein [Actinoplanes sichuanensis]BEL05798.1 hypothetical protein Q0Z83_039890 [Actinoplanes sichuanensis]